MSFWTASRALYRTSWSSWCMWFITSCLPPSCSITLKDRQTERCRSRLLCSVRCSSTRRSGGFCISIELWEWCRTTAGVLRQCSAQSAPPGRNKMRKITLFRQPVGFEKMPVRCCEVGTVLTKGFEIKRDFLQKPCIDTHSLNWSKTRFQRFYKQSNTILILFTKEPKKI